MITLVGVGVMLTGLTRMVVAYRETDLVIWARALYILVGFVALCIGFIAAVILTFGFFVLTVLISTAFVFMGVIRIVSGATGHLK